MESKQPPGKKRKVSAEHEEHSSGSGSESKISPSKGELAVLTKKEKRSWDSWSQDEKELFFQSVKEYGRDFDAITARVKTKNYEQTRHFYYRLLKKINKLVKPHKIDKKDKFEVITALLTYWELKKQQKVVTAKEELAEPFADTLKQLFEKKKVDHLREKDLEYEKYKQSKNNSSVQVNEAKRETVIQPSVPLISPNYPSIKMESSIPLTFPGIATTPMQPQVPIPQKVVQAQHTNVSVPTSQPPVGSPQYFFSTLFKQEPPIPISTPSTIVRNLPLDQTLPDATSLSLHQNLNENMITQNVVAIANDKLTFQFIPKHREQQQMLIDAKLNPRLQVTLKGKKPLSFILDYLTQKWHTAMGKTTVIHLHPLEDQYPNHPGWGVESPTIAGYEIAQAVGSPAIIKLMYTFTDILPEPNTDSKESMESEVIPDTPNDMKSLEVPPVSVSSSSADQIFVKPSLPKSSFMSPTINASNSPKMTSSPFSGSPLPLFSPNKIPSGDYEQSGLTPSPKAFPATPINLNDSSISMPSLLDGDFSVDGFSTNNKDELECKSFYNKFEGASQDSVDSPSTKRINPTNYASPAISGINQPIISKTSFKGVFK